MSVGIIGPGSVMGQVVSQVYSKNGNRKSPHFFGGGREDTPARKGGLSS